MLEGTDANPVVGRFFLDEGKIMEALRRIDDGCQWEFPVAGSRCWPIAFSVRAPLTNTKLCCVGSSPI